jgi:hypothetical protein
MCCNSDILFNTVVVHWVTSKDEQASIISGKLSSGSHNATLRGPRPGVPTSGVDRRLESAILTNISARQRIESDEGSENMDARHDGADDIMDSGICVRTDYTREEVWASREDGNHSESMSLGSLKNLEYQEPVKVHTNT